MLVDVNRSTSHFAKMLFIVLVNIVNKVVSRCKITESFPQESMSEIIFSAMFKMWQRSKKIKNQVSPRSFFPWASQVNDTLCNIINMPPCHDLFCNSSVKWALVHLVNVRAYYFESTDVIQLIIVALYWCVTVPGPCHCKRWLICMDYWRPR